jgi:hypothetical protein
VTSGQVSAEAEWTCVVQSLSCDLDVAKQARQVTLNHNEVERNASRSIRIGRGTTP